MSKGLLSIAGLLIALILFFAVNIAASAVLRGARVDLTEGRLFTLSEGSRAIARKLPEPITLTFYYSEDAANDVPMVKAYASRVREMLQEYQAASDGKIDLRFVNPEPFSEQQDAAEQAGLYGPAVGRGNRLYFGLVGINSTDRTETIPFFAPDKEQFLEYDLTRLIYLLSNPPRKVVGVMTWLPMEGMPINPMTGQRGGSPPWQLLQQMRDLFDVRMIDSTAREIPDDIGVLLIVHPKQPSDDARYAIDQFVLRGGRVLLAVDPLCESDLPPGMNPMQAMNIPKDSDLPDLLSAWGVTLQQAKVAGDLNLAMRVSMGPGEPTALLHYLELPAAQLDADDPITGGLGLLRMISTGILERTPSATTTLEPLIFTTTQSASIDTAEVSFVPDARALLARFTPSGNRLTLAARITGKVSTAFPDGPPAAAPVPDGQPAPEPRKHAHLAESAQPANIIVIADCDMLTDRLWTREQRLGQISLGTTKTADNGDLIIGALDNLGGSSDLMSLRARATIARPFDRVEAIEADARKRFAEKETELQNKLQQLEQEINQIQQTRPDGQASMLLTPEQQAKLEQAMQERLATRKQLRDVQHQLRQDIERLGVAVKAVNLAIMPGLVALAAVGLSAYRASRRRSDRLKPTARD